MDTVFQKILELGNSFPIAKKKKTSHAGGGKVRARSTEVGGREVFLIKNLILGSPRNSLSFGHLNWSFFAISYTPFIASLL